MILLYYPRNAPRGSGRIPLSLLALGAVLEGRIPYRIVDGNVEQRPLDVLTGLIQTDPAHTVLCVSVMPGTQMVNAIHHSRMLKELFPALTVVWGGYFPSMHTESVLNSPIVDYVIRGQGERALPELLDALRTGPDPGEVHNVSRRVNGTIHHGPEYPIFDPNLRPMFPYAAVDMERYALSTFIGKRTYCHESSVGCPHKCNFCGVVDVFHSRWKAETPTRTHEVVHHLKQQYHMDGIEFHDSELFVSESRMIELSELLVDEHVLWWAEGRIDTLMRYDVATWKLMQRSGLRMIFFGAESGLDETLRLMDKGGVTREQTLAMAARCRDFGVQSEFSFVMGSHPTKTEEDIDATIDMMYELERINPLSQMHPFIYTPVPFGTIYDKAVQGGLQYPATLEAWASREWEQYVLRKNPHTPWLTPRLQRRIVNFRAVHQAFFPKTNDRKIARWKILLLKAASAWRYRWRIFVGAYELRVLLRLLVNPAEKHQGF
jgi:anaerobic magnesium-protoporphyrin IX monomethyl ester cyclase